jgi:hypothetical protein
LPAKMAMHGSDILSVHPAAMLTESHVQHAGIYCQQIHVQQTVLLLYTQPLLCMSCYNTSIKHVSCHAQCKHATVAATSSNAAPQQQCVSQSQIGMLRVHLSHRQLRMMSWLLRTNASRLQCATATTNALTGWRAAGPSLAALTPLPWVT